MVPSLDAGPILRQTKVPISSDTTINDLVRQVKEVGAHQILEILEAFERGNPIPATPQNEDDTLRCYPRIPEYNRIDWSQSATQIDRHIRSLGDPYHAAYTYLKGERVKILEAKPKKDDHQFLAEPGHIIATESNGEIEVATGDGILVVKRIRIDDGSEVAPGTKIQSIRQSFGMAVEDEIYQLSERINQLESRVDSTTDL
jgi:methionyl-tRNA formyltransferase